MPNKRIQKKRVDRLRRLFRFDLRPRLRGGRRPVRSAWVTSYSYLPAKKSKQMIEDQIAYTATQNAYRFLGTSFKALKALEEDDPASPAP